MADQTAMTKSNGHAPLGATLGSDRSPDATAGESGANAVVSNVAGFGEDLLNLAELQAQLAVLEARQNVDVLKSGGALIATGLIVALAGLPIGLVGIAELLVSEMGLKRGYALLTVAAVAILIAGSCAGAGASWLRRKRLGFPLSSEELARNVTWIRTVLRQSGRLSFRR
jgi:Putative Actinobacterial Holin-X, holin superfamily III